MTDAGLARQARDETERHWLIFDNERHVTGCHCGFPADPGDDGYGDSIVMHLLTIGAAALSAELAEAKAEVERLHGLLPAIREGYDASESMRVTAEAERDALAAQLDGLRAIVSRPMWWCSPTVHEVERALLGDDEREGGRS